MTAGRQILTSNKEWCTPKKYVDAVSEFFDNQIDLDPCWNEGSLIKAKTSYYLPEKNGLINSWNFKRIYVNPPFGIDQDNDSRIKNWLELCKKANLEYNSEVIALIPVATNTSHWKECIFGFASCICFCYDTRMKFRINDSEDNKGAPMACALVYWGKQPNRFKNIFQKFGFIIFLDYKRQMESNQ